MNGSAGARARARWCGDGAEIGHSGAATWHDGLEKCTGMAVVLEHGTSELRRERGQSSTVAHGRGEARLCGSAGTGVGRRDYASTSALNRAQDGR